MKRTPRNTKGKRKTRMCKRCSGIGSLTTKGYGFIPDYTRPCDGCGGRGTR